MPLAELWDGRPLGSWDGSGSWHSCGRRFATNAPKSYAMPYAMQAHMYAHIRIFTYIHAWTLTQWCKHIVQIKICSKFISGVKGTGGASKRDEFSEKLQSGRGGGGVIFNQKIQIVDFGPLNRAFWAWFSLTFSAKSSIFRVNKTHI